MNIRIHQFISIQLALFFLAMMLIAFSYLLLYLGINERNYRKAFEDFGVRTTAKLIGYRYITHTHREPAGDRPVFSYIANDGVKRTYVAYEYGFASSIKKSVLSTQKVQITYLSYNPNIAHIEKWSRYSYGSLYIVVGVVSGLMSLVLIYLASLDRSR